MQVNEQKFEQLLADSLLSLNKLTTKYEEKNFLEHLLFSVIDIIPSADAGFFFIYDKKMNKLLIQTAIGYNPTSYRKTQLSPGEAITGNVLLGKQTILINGQSEIKKAMNSMTEQNQDYYKASILHEEYPHAVLSFPLLNQEEVTAIFTINGFKDGAYFGDEILKLINQVVPYISLHYSHYLIRKENSKTQNELAITYNALRKEHKQLQRTADLYNDLALLISQNKSYEEMMHAIYMSTQTPVSLFDELLYPIASYGTTENHQLPDNFLSIKEVQYTISVKKWQLISKENDSSLLVMPVVGAETVIGFLCAWIDEETFNDGNRLLLEYSASMLGLERMKKRTIDEIHRKVAGDIFERLISGNYNEDVIRQARNLHLKETDNYAILICEGKPSENHFVQYFVKDSWINWIQQAMKLSSIDGLVTQRGMDIIAFLTVSDEENHYLLRNNLKKLTKRLESMPYDVKVGIGRVYRGFIHVRKSYNDAQQCLQLLDKKKSQKVMRYSDSGIYSLFIDRDKDELELFVKDYLGPLIEIESNKDKELLQTLLIYVEYNRNLKEVTSKLSIHHNTLYYRISRIEQILNLSLSDHTDWMDLSVACKIYQFLNE